MAEAMKLFFMIVGGLAIMSVAYMTGERSGYEKGKEEMMKWLNSLKKKEEDKNE